MFGFGTDNNLAFSHFAFGKGLVPRVRRRTSALSKRVVE